MIREEHMAVKDISSWQNQPHPYQLRHSYHLTTGCRTCWEAVASVTVEPRRHTDPLLRAIARVRHHPRVDLSLPSRSIRPFIDARFQPRKFPSLLLQETIALGCDFGLVSDLANLLVETPDMKGAGANLRVSLYIALVDRYLRDEDNTKAVAAQDTAISLFNSACHPPTAADLALDLALADFKVTCSRLGSDAAIGRIETVHEKFPLILNDPVRRFEAQSELMLGIYGQVTENRTIAEWVLSELSRGPQGHEIQRLSCGFHKARFAKVAATILPDLPQAVASELERSLAGIRIYADPYSLALAHQLLGELRSEEDYLEEALRIYATLELEIAFQEAWRSLERVLSGDESKRNRRRGEISDQAYNVFGKDATLRMIQEMEIEGSKETTGALA